LKDDLAGLRIDRAPESPRSYRWVGWLVVLGLLTGGAAFGWQWWSRERPIEVEAVSVTSRAVGAQAAVLNAAGYVTARRRATISSKVTGKVIEVNVEEGMAVRQGQVLARLDDTKPRAALALAEAQVVASQQALKENEVRLAEATLSLGRMTELLKGGVVTAANVDAAQAEVDSISARIEALRQQVRVTERQVELQQISVDDTVIRAPFSGIAISKDAQPGEMVSPVSAGGGFTRTGISTIVDMSSLEIEVEVNESYIGRVEPNQRVSAVLDAYPEWSIPGRVITTIPSADRQKATVLVRIGFDALDPRILPDMGVKVTFLREAGAAPDPAARPTALVPKAALRPDGDQTYVFLITGGVVERRAVQTGGVDGDRVEVIAGLNPGDRVVISPPPTLTDGAMIVVR
jgi:RND family efflux transporter MFP subunit